MKRLWLILVLCVAPITLMAQELEPRLNVEFETTEAIPGQFLTLRLSVLVPTHMPTPPDWPSFEAPNIVVRLPERASSPISERIDGKTWAGISRRYQIAPIVAGEFAIKDAVVRVTYADPEGGEAIVSELALPEISFTGVIPENARDLDPFVAAKSLTLEQTVEGESETMEAGGSFSRVLTIKAEGLASMFLPVLTPETVPDGLRGYPETPVLQDSDNRGETTGTRIETSVFVAQGAVNGSLPEVKLRWFNVESETIEEVSVPAIEVQAKAPVGSGPLVGARGSNRGLGAVLQFAGVVIFALLLGGAAWRWWPRWQAWRSRRRAEYEAGEQYAWKVLLRAQKCRDLEACRSAYDVWLVRLGPINTQHREKISQCFVTLGSSRFSNNSQDQQSLPWTELATTLRQARSARHDRQQNRSTLPPLNPTAHT